MCAGNIIRQQFSLFTQLLSHSIDRIGPPNFQCQDDSLFPMCYGPEFVAKAVQEWIAAEGAKAAYIEQSSPWENDYIESLMRA